jgi:hypothetical protein
VKKSLLWFAVALFVVTLSKPVPLMGDEAPVCGPTGCQKPGLVSQLK